MSSYSQPVYCAVKLKTANCPSYIISSMYNLREAKKEPDVYDIPLNAIANTTAEWHLLMAIRDTEVGKQTVDYLEYHLTNPNFSWVLFSTNEYDFWLSFSYEQTREGVNHAF